ncbi:hypothetical protein G443_003128 [Actinoalloteichus cyanogriseus DSM 43889]|uniref:Uncharacterized protein n=1 Tax=Actinoalloteichus caeruleus DSM 43889 TaxID=1120930 RepID=A0ABT1JK22_ACTCY|nr:hypothetical protein [Actinoalloteichus caeruleus DSM 43889]
MARPRTSRPSGLAGTGAPHLLVPPPTTRWSNGGRPPRDPRAGGECSDRPARVRGTGTLAPDPIAHRWPRPRAAWRWSSRCAMPGPPCSARSCPRPFSAVCRRWWGSPRSSGRGRRGTARTPRTVPAEVVERVPPARADPLPRVSRGDGPPRVGGGGRSGLVRAPPVRADPDDVRDGRLGARRRSVNAPTWRPRGPDKEVRGRAGLVRRYVDVAGRRWCRSWRSTRGRSTGGKPLLWATTGRRTRLWSEVSAPAGPTPHSGGIAGHPSSRPSTRWHRGGGATSGARGRPGDLRVARVPTTRGAGQGSQDRCGPSSAYPTKATTSMSACPTTRAHNRLVRCQYLA